MRTSRLLTVLAVCALANACNPPEASDPLDLMDASYVVFAPVDEQEVPARIRLMAIPVVRSRHHYLPSSATASKFRGALC